MKAQTKSAETDPPNTGAALAGNPRSFWRPRRVAFLAGRAALVLVVFAGLGACAQPFAITAVSLQAGQSQMRLTGRHANSEGPERAPDRR